MFEGGSLFPLHASTWYVTETPLQMILGFAQSIIWSGVSVTYHYKLKTLEFSLETGSVASWVSSGKTLGLSAIVMILASPQKSLLSASRIQTFWAVMLISSLACMENLSESLKGFGACAEPLCSFLEVFPCECGIDRTPNESFRPSAWHSHCRVLSIPHSLPWLQRNCTHDRCVQVHIYTPMHAHGCACALAHTYIAGQVSVARVWLVRACSWFGIWPTSLLMQEEINNAAVAPFAAQNEHHLHYWPPTQAPIGLLFIWILIL